MPDLKSTLLRYGRHVSRQKTLTRMDFPITREEALRRLDDFVPVAGSAYARLRNKDRGKDDHIHVSRLSAALRRRLISEGEVVEAVLRRHGLSAAEKYVSEIFWRTYWKGWLEQRPAVWRSYLEAVKQSQEQVMADPGIKIRYVAAIEARTGIDCFDAWAAELEDTGYMHNWARMQFASIWIFTLGLPWELGAAYMFDRLIDADSASNTLSWRWVAGLHTAGKAYLADAERITAMTDGRYAPRGLARTARIPADNLETPPVAAIRPFRTPDLAAASLLLLTAEDLSVERIAAFRALPVRAIAVAAGRNGWDDVALADGLSRALEAWPNAPQIESSDARSVAAASKELGCTQVVTAFLPVGPQETSLSFLRSELEGQGLVFSEYLRAWDRNAWPYCRRGFFGLKEKIPSLVQKMSD